MSKFVVVVFSDEDKAHERGYAPSRSFIRRAP
jgi:hypothetical protein